MFVLTHATFAKAMLMFGIAITLAATPGFVYVDDDQCKIHTQVNSTGAVSCDSDLGCTTTGHTCRETKWHQNVQDPYIKYCQCGISDQYSGPDPTTGLCMAYSVVTGTTRKRACSSGGCNADEECTDKNEIGGYKKCTCQPTSEDPEEPEEP